MISAFINFALAFAFFIFSSQLPAQEVLGGPGNPLFDGADPDITIADGKYWIYPTCSGGPNGPAFFVYSSSDLQTWVKTGPILSFRDVPWINDDGRSRHYAWAPGIFQSDDHHFYLYYSVGPQNEEGPSRIGVAVSDSPGGVFKDSGKVLLTGDAKFEAIDAMVFEDKKDGRVYLYAGGSAASKLHIFELNPDLVSIAREIPVKNPPKFTEGTYMTERNRIYYLSYSHGDWRDASYSVHYCTAPSPTGPWTYKGAILTSTDQNWGPGHHAIFQDPRTEQWYIVYHRWNHVVDGIKPRSRSICIDPLNFDQDGNIQPVQMTDSGGAPSPQ